MDELLGETSRPSDSQDKKKENLLNSTILADY